MIIIIIFRRAIWLVALTRELSGLRGGCTDAFALGHPALDAHPFSFLVARAKVVEGNASFYFFREREGEREFRETCYVCIMPTTDF
jgi:hypothetical protein